MNKMIPWPTRWVHPSPSGIFSSSTDEKLKAGQQASNVSARKICDTQRTACFRKSSAAGSFGGSGRIFSPGKSATPSMHGSLSPNDAGMLGAWVACTAPATPNAEPQTTVGQSIAPNKCHSSCFSAVNKSRPKLAITRTFWRASPLSWCYSRSQACSVCTVHS
jgi:hypothetical protein